MLLMIIFILFMFVLKNECKIYRFRLRTESINNKKFQNVWLMGLYTILAPMRHILVISYAYTVKNISNVYVTKMCTSRNENIPKKY